MKKNDYTKKIKILLSTLQNSNIIKSLNKISGFYDDPHFFIYTALLKNQHNNSNRASGLSFTSAGHALIKCLGEASERFCLLTPRKEILVSKPKLKEDKIDLSIYIDTPIKEKDLLWVKGFNLTKGKSCLIPAQLIYLNYKEIKKESRLKEPIISTGAAGGFDHESTLLRGIYETVERDSFMTMFLNKIKTSRIDLNTIQNKTLQDILEKCRRYKLSLNIFELTTNLGIPTYLSVLIDSTGLGPVVSLGAKSEFNKIEAILGAAGESFMLRPWLKELFTKTMLNNYKDKIDLSDLFTRKALDWFDERILERLDFFFEGKTLRFAPSSYKGNKREELEKVISLLKKCGYDIYYVDITVEMLKKIGYRVYKVIIPGLQSLHLHEEEKVFRMKRLKEVSVFFGQEKLLLNKEEQPFL